METLILNQAYMPHRVVRWQTAVSMFFTGKVEVVEEYEELIRSVSLTVRMPAVVRLVRRGRHSEPKIRFSRGNVLLRDGYTCQYCRAVLPSHELTFDHVVPRSQGGRTSWENIVACCRPCNALKGNRTPQQAGMKLLATPERPRALPFKLKQLRLARPMPDLWKQWVWWTN
ncbi:MAG: HNH endonuclease [Sandaracinaceae bacterium]|nr:HNH endonuclease [Sandaracinaceae bacterium]